MDGRPLACAALSERFRGVFDQWEVDILVTSLMFDVSSNLIARLQQTWRNAH
jgi:hypothetical protein